MQINSHVVRRWIDILILSLVGTIGFLLLSEIAGLKEWAKSFATLPPLVQIVLAMFGGAALLVPLLHFVHPTWKQFRLFHLYPPVWLASIVGIAGIFAVRTYYGLGPVYEVWDWLLAGLSVAIGIAMFLYYSRSSIYPLAPVPIRSAPNHKPLGDWKSIESWIHSKEVIQQPDQDHFGHLSLAKRMAGILLESNRSGDLASIGLMGPYGSGKSSLLNLVEHELKSQRVITDSPILLCRVSCWGFDDSSAALSHVLSEVVSTLGGYVDTISIRSLPESYQKTLAAAGSWWQTLGEGLASTGGPTEQLKRLEPVLAATKIRLVIAIEDVDRNESRSFDPQQIQSMLERIRSVKGVTFILSAGSTANGRVDFAKLCDHIERIPSINWRTMFAMMKTLRSRCLSFGHIIDPLSVDLRNGFEQEFLRSPITLEQINSAMDPGTMAGSRAVLSLMRTPRALKHALRHTLKTWSALNGEIDFDDLLLANILRYGAPEAFDFLVEHGDTFRLSSKEPDNDLKKNALTEKRKKYRRLWASTANNASWDPSSALQLIVHLFPAARPLLSEGRPSIRDKRIQGVQITEPNDYWERLLAEGLGENEPRDQHVLKLIANAADGSISDLAKWLLRDEKHADIWEHFAASMRGDRLLLLAESVIDLLIATHGSKAVGDHDALIAIWRRSNRRTQELIDAKDWLTRQVTKALPTSIQLCNDLYYYWTSFQYGIVSVEERDDVRRAIYDATKTNVAFPSSEAFINALNSGKPYTLYQLVFSPDNRDPQSVLCEPEDWRWLAPLIVNAAKANPDVLIPQITYLVGNFSHQRTDFGHEEMYLLNHELVGKLFGTESRAAYKELLKPITAHSEKIQTFVNAARVQASEWLATDMELKK
jgi:hypothetical protein